MRTSKLSGSPRAIMNCSVSFNSNSGGRSGGAMVAGASSVSKPSSNCFVGGSSVTPLWVAGLFGCSLEPLIGFFLVSH